MYKLTYKSTQGSQGDQDVKEYSVWLEQEPSAEEKEELIRELSESGEIEVREDNGLDRAKRYESYQHTVMVLNNDKPEVMYKRKEARDITFYSDGTYTVDEGISHNFNDNYFETEMPKLKEDNE